MSTPERIHLSLADVGPLEEQAVARAMQSGWIAPLGPEVDAFEAEMSAYVGSGVHCLALSSGTAALHLALLGAGVTHGDVVPVSSLTFAATTNSLEYVGAVPHFVDCCEDGNINPELLLAAVDDLRAAGHRVPAVLVVDLLGRPCDYREFTAALEEREVALIEDAAESLGASVDGQGAGSFGFAAALSFNGNKIMTTSGGGMLLSRTPEVIDRARYLSTQARLPVAWYEHDEIGYNYRLSNILAALGRAQLSRLDDMTARRREIRGRYAEVVEGTSTRLLGDLEPRNGIKENYWLTAIVLGDDVELDPSGAVEAFGTQNIEARHLWKPMHAQPLYAEAQGHLDGTADRLFARGLTLPSGSELTDEKVDRVCEFLSTIVRP